MVSPLYSSFITHRSSLSRICKEKRIQYRISKMSQNIQRRFKKTRFAPSPTGFLHRGHILSSIWVWGMARITGSSVLLRIEDHDLSRCRESHVSAILSDLEWLGFRWDEYSRQSTHNHRYSKGLEALRGSGNLVYGCDCTRAQLSHSPAYDGRCRQRGLATNLASGTALRVEIPEMPVAWEDLRLGAFLESPSQQCGDIMLRDRLGQWTYQYAVTMDDHEEGVDLVVRGEDLVDSTARQIMLAQMLGRPIPPAFLHHPLLYEADGSKLSKRQLSRSIASERAEGISPARMLGEVCLAGGLIAEFRDVTMEDLGNIISRAIKVTVREH